MESIYDSKYWMLIKVGVGSLNRMADNDKGYSKSFRDIKKHISVFLNHSTPCALNLVFSEPLQ